jgi:hypothetical protein
MTQNDPEMTQKLPSFWIGDLSGKMPGFLGHELGDLLGHDFALNDPAKSQGIVRVCEKTRRSG